MKILEMTDISKSFFGVEVLHHVNFDVEEGEVHALLGENGAGKSTLMNILGGVYTKDSGNVVFYEKAMDNVAVKDANAAGIAFVHQELNVINDLRVYENIFLNHELTNGIRKLKKHEMIHRSEELFSRLGVDIDPTEEVGKLETGRKQLLEIAKAFHSEAKLFILDEPTTALNNVEIEHLFGIIGNLKSQGKTFIFISHKMPEIFRIADRYTVFRNGNHIKTGQIVETNPEEVTRLMVGEKYSNREVYETRELGDVVIQLNNFSGPGFEHINLQVRKGEVVGLTGLKGSGSSELLQSIFGAQGSNGGTVEVRGKVSSGSNLHRSMLNKLGMLPANRKENSVLPSMSILENTYISEFCLSGWRPRISVRKEMEKYNRLKELLNIKANSAADPLVSLSGGNQQKVLLARWLNTNAEILLLDNPTQGIDVGAKAEIYKLIVDLASRGITVLISTLEIPEIQKVADRCVVFYHGRISTILNRDEVTEETVMLYATSAISGQSGEDVNVKS
jgi:ribose transport system ATP-binding protein